MGVYFLWGAMAVVTFVTVWAYGVGRPGNVIGYALALLIGMGVGAHMLASTDAKLKAEREPQIARGWR